MSHDPYTRCSLEQSRNQCLYYSVVSLSSNILMQTLLSGVKTLTTNLVKVVTKVNKNALLLFYYCRLYSAVPSMFSKAGTPTALGHL